MNLPFAEFFADPTTAEVAFRGWCSATCPHRTDFPALFDEWLDSGWDAPAVKVYDEWRTERRTGLMAAALVLVPVLVSAVLVVVLS